MNEERLFNHSLYHLVYHWAAYVATLVLLLSLGITVCVSSPIRYPWYLYFANIAGGAASLYFLLRMNTFGNKVNSLIADPDGETQRLKHPRNLILGGFVTIVIVILNFFIISEITSMAIIAASIGVFIAIAVFGLVVFAMRQDPPKVEEDPPTDWRPDEDLVKTLYTATTSLYIEVDREIWQIATIFLAASLGVMGWVVVSLAQLTIYMVIVLGCASITLVGVATLFKHRLREFNLIHLGFLQRLEHTIGSRQAETDYWGLHHVRRRLMESKGSIAKTVRSIHCVMEIYFFFFIGLWIALGLYKLADP